MTQGMSLIRRLSFGALAVAVGFAVTLAISPAARGDGHTYAWDYDIRVDLATLAKEHSPAPYVVDWNNDGRDDLLVGFRFRTQSGGIGVYLRNADGSLGPVSSVFTVGTDAASAIGETFFFRPTVGDWNGDGRKDLLFGQQDGNKGVVACLNQGSDTAPRFDGFLCTQLRTITGTVVGQTTPEGTGNVAFVSPDLVDWDNDGDLDVLVGSGSQAREKGVRLYENVGTSVLPVIAQEKWVVSKIATLGLGSETNYEPTVVDIDRDGNKDLLVAGSLFSSPNREFILRRCLNTGSDANPQFLHGCSDKILPGLVNNVVDAADWDRDGFVDLLRGFHSAFIANTVTMLHGKAPDSDGDGVSDTLDNCVDVSNPARVKLDRTNPVQLDTDGDGRGDPCDDDLDGDSTPNGSDNCLFTVNPDQVDVDVDVMGDACDPRDGRPDYPGVGSYEWEMANRMQWGRRPVIIMRADAMSIGYRQDIAQMLTAEALERDMAFTMAVIPWDDARFSQARGTGFIRKHADEPDLEFSQHGTYHTCVVVGKINVGEEFGAACGMDESESFNLMRVGEQSMENALAPVAASHQLTGFIPPADAANDAAVAASRALGHHYFASAWYREPEMFHIDDTGMVHIPWSQIACGNGAASWTNCGVANLEAHSGIDCADESLCRPTREPVPKDYSNWSVHADTRLAERCRNDLVRFDGVCAILFELTSYDGNFATGEPDPRAISAFEATLDELKAMAEEENAVFMTLGQYAAALQMEDTTPPAITIGSPATTTYGHHEVVPLTVDVTDEMSGVYDVDMTVDGSPIEAGAELDLLKLSLGEHTLSIRAEDTAGNVSETSVTFAVEATIATLRGTVERFVADGRIADEGLGDRLLNKLDAADEAEAAGNNQRAANHLNTFSREVEAQSGRQIQAAAADLLVADARVVRHKLLSG